ncbi:MAG: hypothetical protein ACRDBG_16090 [Waterburya sp.]
MPTIKQAEVTQITIANTGILFNGLMFPNGEYAIAIPQIVELNLVPPNRSVKQLQTLVGIAFPSHQKATTVLNSKAVNVISLEDFNTLLCKLAFAGNEFCQNWLLACSAEKLTREFDRSFNVLRTEREHAERFAARIRTKDTFRPLTDALKEAGFEEGWEYGKFIKEFQDALGFESGMRDTLDLQTLLMLGNCQMELRMLMKAGYEPWIALSVWKENKL